MTSKFTLDKKLSDTVSTKLYRLVRLMQSQDTPEGIIQAMLYDLHKVIPDERNAVISVVATIEKKG